MADLNWVGTCGILSQVLFLQQDMNVLLNWHAICKICGRAEQALAMNVKQLFGLYHGA